MSNVTTMVSMFNEASSFNQPLNDWNVSNVTNMRGMFIMHINFNQPLNDWNVSNVTTMMEYVQCFEAVLSINLSMIGMCPT